MSFRVLLRAFVLLCGIIAPVSAGLFRVWVHRENVNLGYALMQETRELDRLRAKLRKLEVELAAEHAPDRLAVLARELGLQAPSPAQGFALGPKGAER